MVAAQTRESRRITGATTAPPSARPEPLTARERQLRQRYEAQIARLEDDLKEMRMSILETDRAQRQDAGTKALAMYGESEDVKGLTARLQYLLPNAQEIGQVGVALVAQIAIAHGLDPLPGSDHVYAWRQDSSLTVVIGYKGLLHLARKRVRFTYQSRPMNEDERAEHGLADHTLGYVTTLYDIAEAAECKHLGIAYFPIIGSAVWSPGDKKPAGRTGAWVAKKNSLKDALRQITSTGQRLDQALDAAFAQQLHNAEYTGEGWRVTLDDDAAQALIDAGDVPPDDDGPAILDGDFASRLPRCAACGAQPVDPASPFPALCAPCARARADAEVADA